MRRHHHLEVLTTNVAILATGAALVYVTNWAARGALIVAAITLLATAWKQVNYVPKLLTRFFLAIRNNDFMTRYPKSGDRTIQALHNQMNNIMSMYSNSLYDIETKRLYYDRILHTMTHELRNSMTPITALTDDMLKHRDAYDEETITESLEVINGQCKSIMTFLNSYYDLTHLPKPNIEEVEVGPLFRKIETLFSSEQYKCEITFKAPEGMIFYGDHDLILQVLNNLIKNAVEAMDGIDDQKLEIEAQEAGGKTTISVSDNGPGIGDGKQNDIFLPFYTTKAGGSGIGLCLSKQIMKMHKGDLTCGKSKWGGAKFTLEI